MFIAQLSDINPFAILAWVFLLLCAYSAQYWAKKCFTELKAIKEDLKRLNK